MEFKEVDLESEVAENTEKEESITSDTKQSALKSSFVSDSIKVLIIPEKKGNFIKHTEYEIRSEKYNCSVERRYNDFLTLHENLLKVYEYRSIPRLPPKQFMLDAFLEERRVGLQRWLIIVSQHAIISKDILLKNFLTETTFALPTVSSEFSDFLSRNIQSLKLNDLEEVQKKQNLARLILNNIIILKRIMNEQLKRQKYQSSDFSEMCIVLNDLMDTTSDDAGLKDIIDNFRQIPKVSSSNNKNCGAIEQLELIIEVLIGYDDACERVKILNETCDDEIFNRQKIKNLLRGTVIETIDTRRRRVLFGISCMIEEFKLVQNYLKLLPSILLKFTYQESQIFTQISKILQNIIDIESDKLN